MSKPGWLKAQIEDVKAEIRNWPQWMRQARGLEALDTHPSKQAETPSEEKLPRNTPQEVGA